EVGPDTRVLLGFRGAEHAEAASLFAGGPAIATDDGSVGRHGFVTELLRDELEARPCTPVGLPRCWRQSAPSAPNATSLRSSPSSLEWPAASAPASAASSPRRTATSACAWTAPCSTPPTSRSWRRIDRALRNPAPRPGAERLRHLRRDRRPPHVRRRPARELPVRRLRVEDDHARPAPGQPAAAPVGDARGADQLDR